MDSFDFYAEPSETSATAELLVVATYFDQDLIGSTGTMLHGFYASGQLWALLIGVVLGYTFKSMFSYG
ncbi:MAG: hypothetical protein HC800_00880 [Phormidesmis sp. RL_2_1]|nr:hypothetical protein [Phormidesmis sp. RL_2_1]